MKIALAQINPTIGDFRGNLERIHTAVDTARSGGAALAVFPELAVCGYPPHDLLERRDFQRDAAAALDRVRELADGIGILIGHIAPNPAGTGKPLLNAATLFDGKRALFTYAKRLLPTYDVFDERRYFEPGTQSGICEFRGRRLGVSICEDAWNDAEFWRRRLYDADPIAALAVARPDVILNLSASPFWLDKEDMRLRMLGFQAGKHGLPIVHVNQVGGNDELIFDGHSFAVNARGEMLYAAPGFVEHVGIVDLDGPAVPAPATPRLEMALQALLLGLRDYLRKCGFEKAVIGLSGGIDSALVAALAAMALGPENVLGVTLPSRFSSPGSVEDSRELARRLGIAFETISIEPAFAAYLETLRPKFGDAPMGVAEENLQARIRGNLLMALSNRYGSLVLSTGNKSELACGYCTLYGDMAGGLAVIGDLPKTLVYELSRHINATRGEWIPRPILDKEPSAELRPNQKDSDSLPPYAQLDPILQLYIEEQLPVDEIAARGFDAALARRVVALVDRNEYKRRQAAPALKVTPKSFGAGRRMPMSQRYAHEDR